MSGSRTPTSTARRRLLALGALFATGAPLAAQGRAAIGSDRLGQAWRLPDGAHVELQIAQAGLDLAGALAAVQDWRIPASAKVSLRLDDGAHAQAGPMAWRHADGARIAVIGNLREPAACRLIWQGGVDGFYVGAGQVLGELDGVTLVQGSASGSGSGLLADEGGVILAGKQLRIEGFYYGVQARRNGAVRCEGIQVSGGGDANFFAYMGGHVHAPGTLSSGARDDAHRLGSGFVAEYGGSLDAVGAVARLNALDGFTALSNGVIRAHGSRAERNARSGYYADTGGRIVAHDAVAKANCGVGLLTRDGPRAITGDRLADADNNAAADTCRAR